MSLISISLTTQLHNSHGCNNRFNSCLVTLARTRDTPYILLYPALSCSTQ